MPTLIITVDPDCCRCSAKLQKVLCRIQDKGEFVIDKILYEGDKVLVSGPFDAEKLYCKLCCKLHKIVKDIQVAKPPPVAKPPDKKKPEPPPCKPVYVYPYPNQQGPSPWPWPPPPCGCPTPSCDCGQHAKPPPPWPLCVCPAPFCGCGHSAKPPPTCVCPPPYCWCSHAKRPAPTPPPETPKPPPEPPKPVPTCGCPTWPSCRCYSGYPPPYMPYGPMLVCEESPPACGIM